MTNRVSESLRIEPLSIAHLHQLQVVAEAGQLPQLQSVLLGEWLARIEQRFPDLLPSRSPRCLVALESDRPVAAVVVRPYNRRGSCWSLQLPCMLQDPQQDGFHTTQLRLLQQALQQGSPLVRSWVVSCCASDPDQIALVRELGFQPLRTLQVWSPPSASAKEEPSRSSEQDLPHGLTWESVNRRTAQLLWPVEQGGSFSHLRQITDRHWLDLLDRRGPGCGVLMAGNTALAGCLRLGHSDRSDQRELLRDVAWDPRLELALPRVLQRIQHSSDPSRLTLISALDDDPLNALLDDQGWRRQHEQLMLGRSMWRRQSTPRALTITRPLGQVFGRLRPGQTPIPTPFTGRR